MKYQRCYQAQQIYQSKCSDRLRTSIRILCYAHLYQLDIDEQTFKNTKVNCNIRFSSRLKISKQKRMLNTQLVNQPKTNTKTVQALLHVHYKEFYEEKKIQRRNLWD